MISRRCASALLLPIGLAAATLHGALRKSSPGKGEHLGAAPRELRLTFNERVEIALARITLSGPVGAVGTEAPALHPDSNSVVIVPIVRGFTVSGTYTVNWQIAGADGHPVRDSFQFVIAPGATGLVAVPSSIDSLDPDATTHHPADIFPRSSSFDAESPLYSGIRWLGFLGLLGVIGMVAFRAVLALLRRMRPGEFDDFRKAAARRAARLGVGLATLTLVAGVLRLGAQSYALHGPAEVFAAGPFWSMITKTVWGWGWLLQMSAALVAVLAFAQARRGRSNSWLIAALACVGLALSAALSGHASAAPQWAPLPVITDAMHIIGAGGWLGTLLAIVFVGLPLAGQRPDRTETVSALIHAFSPTALCYAALTVTTGLFAAWIHLGGVTALWESPYGRILMIKLGVLLGVFGTGAYNWLRVRPALGQDTAGRRLQRSAQMELGIGVIVLVVTAVLVATPTPMPDARSARVESATR